MMKLVSHAPVDAAVDQVKCSTADIFLVNIIETADGILWVKGLNGILLSILLLFLKFSVVVASLQWEPFEILCLQF